jgi:type VI secretion system protein ImpF
MAPSRSAIVVPSVLDRLISDPRNVEIGAVQPGSLRALKLSVERDLDALLNTRREGDLIPPEFQASAQSLLNFGLPDFSSYMLRSSTDQNRLRRDMETAIRAFEPRLANVTVSVEGWDDLNPVLRFRVEGILRVDPAPEPVSFDTVFRADTGKFAVRGRAA